MCDGKFVPRAAMTRIELLESRLHLTIVVNTTADDGSGSLRQAIITADATPGQKIIFAIPNSDPGFAGGVYTIEPLTPLPQITAAMTIDGTTQSGFTGKPVIELDAEKLTDGLVVNGGVATIRGLIINKYSNSGISLITGGNTIAGNYIGTNASGTAAASTGSQFGVDIFSTKDVIGGADASERNIISGNTASGVNFDNPITGTTGPSQTTIYGNYIGTDFLGSSAIPNGTGIGGVAGIDGTIIGGADPGQGNLISGNQFAIKTSTGIRNATIQGNLIGTQADGISPLGNTQGGIWIDGVNSDTGTVIGGDTPAAGNVIAAGGSSNWAAIEFTLGAPGASNNTIEHNYIGTDRSAKINLGNAGAGIEWGGTNDVAQSNTIANNAGGGISLMGNLAQFMGHNVTGAGDAVLGNMIDANGNLAISLSGGVNGLQNFPIINTAVSDDTNSSVSFSLNSTPNHTFRVEFFSSPTVGANGSGQGAVFLGFKNLVTESDGNVSGTANLPAVAAGQFITATATDQTTGAAEFNDTSEFSAPVKVIQRTPTTTSVKINSGGGAVDGFAADEDFSGGKTYSTTSAIDEGALADPPPQNVMQTERFGNFTYTIPSLTPGSSYTVRLDFAEIYWTAPNQRLFNVSINGSQVLSNFDIFAAADGENIAIDRTFTATANSSGEITITFTSIKDNAKVDGIEVYPLATTPPPVTTMPLKIDSGGPASGPFVADEDVSGGSTYSTTAAIDTSAISNPAPQAVYQTERFGNFTYTIPGLIAGDSYTVQLDFDEIYWNAPGQRLFNVAINGTQVLSSFDIFATAGAKNKAVAETFTATADSSGTLSIVFTSIKDNAKVDGIEISPATSPTPTPSPTRINAGGPAVSAFSADTDFSGGSTYSTTSSIDTSGVPSPAPQQVYQTERFGNFTYTIPGLTAGNQYTVQLDFDEIYWNAANQRLFNVAINGNTALNHFDIFAAAGGKNKAIDETFTATANSGGQIVIAFTTIKDNAKVDGIEVTPIV